MHPAIENLKARGFFSQCTNGVIADITAPVSHMALVDKDSMELNG